MTHDYAPDSWQAKAMILFSEGNSDARIAGIVGVQRQTVGALRYKHDIPGFKAGRTFTPTEQQLEELRKFSDREMQRRYGKDQTTWRKVRGRYGIERHRPPTVIDGVPNAWKERKVSLVPFKPREFGWHNMRFNQISTRPVGLAAEAADFMRKDRPVYDRKKIGVGDGWQVGSLVMTDAEMIAKAESRGFRRQEWMGEAA